MKSDNLIAVNIICDQSKEIESNLVQIIKEQLARDWHIKVSYTSCSANMIVDSSYSSDYYGCVARKIGD